MPKVSSSPQGEFAPSGFGARLKELRTEAGLTQQALGERAGVGYQVVTKYESGKREPMWPMVIRLAKALGVTPDAFLPAEPPAVKKPPPRPKNK